MEPAPKKQKTSHLQHPDESSSSSGICAVETGRRDNHMEDFIPRCHLISSTIFKHLSAKEILKLSKVSRTWFTPCRNYLRSNQKDHQCLLVLDKVDGLDALQRLIQVLDDKILGLSHPFTGVHFRFSDPFDDFFKTGTGPNKRPPPVAPEDPDDYPMFEDYGVDDNDSDYDDTNNDYTQDYESFDAWMFTQREEAFERRQEQAKLDVPLKRIFAKIPSIKHVHIVVDYGTKRGFNGDKFKRFMSLLPLHQIEYFRTNLRISEFSGDLRQGQLSNLKNIDIDNLMNVMPSTLNKLLAACPVLENWNSPIPGHMVASFGTKRHLIKNLIMYKFVKATHFDEIRQANLSLTSLIANSSRCAIGKGSYDDIIGIIRDNSTSLQTIQMSDAFLKHLLKSNLTPIYSVRKIIIVKCAKSNKAKALEIFPNAIFVSKLLIEFF